MENNNTLTAKEWLKTQNTKSGWVIGGHDVVFEAMEDYASYKTKVLEDRILDFEDKLNIALQTFSLQTEFQQHVFISDLLVGYRKHFNITTEK